MRSVGEASLPSDLNWGRITFTKENKNGATHHHSDQTVFVDKYITRNTPNKLIYPKRNGPPPYAFGTGMIGVALLLLIANCYLLATGDWRLFWHLVSGILKKFLTYCVKGVIIRNCCGMSVRIGP